MPLALALLAIDAVFIAHAVRTGRPWPWVWVILALPGAGALAYVGFALAPAWLSEYRADQVRRRIARALAPERRYRALRDQLAAADTIAIRAALARQCCELELFEEAHRHHQAILARLPGRDRSFMRAEAPADAPVLTPAPYGPHRGRILRDAAFGGSSG